MEDLITQFSSGVFNIDCSQIRIQQRGHESKYYFSGPGYIYLDNNIIKFKIYPQSENSASLTLAEKFSIDFPSKSQAGQIFPEDHYYDLTATDIKNCVWSSQYFRPYIRFDMAGNGNIITGQLRSVSAERETPSRSTKKSLTLYFHNKPDYPTNRTTQKEVNVGDFRRESSKSWDAAEIETGNLKHYIEAVGSTFSICTTFEEALNNDNLARCISEALSFSFGEEFTPFSAFYTEPKKEFVRLSSTVRPRPNNKFPPFHDTYKNNMTAWGLFSSYLNYCINYGEENVRPLSSHIIGCIRAQDGSLDAYALSLALAVEGVAKLGLNSLGTPDDSIKSDITKLMNLIEESSVNEQIKHRAKGALSSIKSPRAEDKLRAAAKSYIINENLISIWKNLRNTYAHADLIDQDKIQIILDRCGSTRTLLNQLIFYIIGYSGPYTDYSMLGWPTAEYPPPQNAPTFPTEQ